MECTIYDIRISGAEKRIEFLEKTIKWHEDQKSDWRKALNEVRQEKRILSALVELSPTEVDLVIRMRGTGRTIYWEHSGYGKRGNWEQRGWMWDGIPVGVTALLRAGLLTPIDNNQAYRLSELGESVYLPEPNNPNRGKE